MTTQKIKFLFVVMVVVVVAAASTLIESQGAERSAAPERSPVTAAAHITFHPARRRQAGAQFNASCFAQGVPNMRITSKIDFIYQNVGKRIR